MKKMSLLAIAFLALSTQTTQPVKSQSYVFITNNSGTDALVIGSGKSEYGNFVFKIPNGKTASIDKIGNRFSDRGAITSISNVILVGGKKPSDLDANSTNSFYPAKLNHDKEEFTQAIAIEDKNFVIDKDGVFKETE